MGQKSATKSAVFLLLTAVGVLAAGAFAYRWFGVQQQVCAAAMEAASLPPDLQYTGGFVQGRRQTVFTRYEMATKALLRPESQIYLSRINAALEARGTHLMFLLVPPRAVVLGSFNTDKVFDAAALEANYRARLEQLRSTGMLVPDALTVLQTQLKPQEAFYARDTHWMPDGAALVAKALASQIKQLPFYGSLSPQAYTTQVKAVDEHKGNYSFPLHTVCGSDIIPERLERRETVSNAPAAGLLDEAMPPVTLVGTSFSNRTSVDLFNFAGALRQELQQDVLNQAVDGGGYDAAILNYIDSDAYRHSPPKVLVWEIISEMEQNHAHIYRQLLPTIAGNCIPLYKQDVALQNGGILMDVPAGLGIAGPKHYISVALSDLAALSFNLTLEYADHQQEVFKFDRSNRVPNNGRYFLELSDQYTAPLVRVSADAGSGTASSALCTY